MKSGAQGPPDQGQIVLFSDSQRGETPQSSLVSSTSECSGPTSVSYPVVKLLGFCFLCKTASSIRVGTEPVLFLGGGATFRSLSPFCEMH